MSSSVQNGQVIYNTLIKLSITLYTTNYSLETSTFKSSQQINNFGSMVKGLDR
jgi:hypothetical protein